MHLNVHAHPSTETKLVQALGMAEHAYSSIKLSPACFLCSFSVWTRSPTVTCRAAPLSQLRLDSTLSAYCLREILRAPPKAQVRLLLLLLLGGRSCLVLRRDAAFEDAKYFLRVIGKAEGRPFSVSALKPSECAHTVRCCCQLLLHMLLLLFLLLLWVVLLA